MGFLEDELDDDEGDSFLQDHVSESGGFLEEQLEGDRSEGSSVSERLGKPPHPIQVSDEELKEMDWPDNWVDRTEDWEDYATSMKTLNCECGRYLCVTKRNRSMKCSKCGRSNIDFNWEDDRIKKEKT